MKTNNKTLATSITVCLCFLLAALCADAKIWRVNGNPGVDADFTQITTAHSNASVLAGDTLIVEPLLSGGAYNGVNFTKRLSIYGSGYFLSQNDSMQATTINTRISWGSTFSAGSEFSLLSGFIVTPSASYSPTQLTINASSVTIEKCYFDNAYISIHISASATGTTIRKCYFTGTTNGSTSYYYIGFLSSGNIITNNIFNPSTTNGHRDITTDVTGTAIISNNVFSKEVYANNSFLTNNIFKGTTAPIGNSNTFNNNLFAANPTVTGASNQFNVDMSTVFVGGSHPEEQFKLKAGSPAIGAGTGGSNCGAFGGTDPYMLSGMPPIPSIFFFSADSLPGIGSNAINVQIKAKVNK